MTQLKTYHSEISTTVTEPLKQREVTSIYSRLLESRSQPEYPLSLKYL